MVNIIENRALVTGVVKSVSSHPDARGSYQVSFTLLIAADLDDLPNLARADEGTDIQIRMPKVFIEDNNVQPDAEISINVRKAFGQVYFVHE